MTTCFMGTISNLEEDLDDDEILMREYEDLKNGYTPNEGNWGAWLHAMGKLKSFTWIGNKTSANVDRLNFITENLMEKIIVLLLEKIFISLILSLIIFSYAVLRSICQKIIGIILQCLFLPMKFFPRKKLIRQF